MRCDRSGFATEAACRLHQGRDLGGVCRQCYLAHFDEWLAAEKKAGRWGKRLFYKKVDYVK